MSLAALRARESSGDLSAGVLADHYSREGLGTIIIYESPVDQLAVEAADLTTNQKLAALGFTTEPGQFGCKRIFKDGVFQYEGRAHDIDSWLRDRESYD